MTRLTKLSFCLIAAVSISTPALSATDKIPYSTLVKNYDSCIANATTLKDWVPAYCMCVTTGINNNLKHKDYLALTSQMTSTVGNDEKTDKMKALAENSVREISSKCKKAISEEM